MIVMNHNDPARVPHSGDVELWNTTQRKRENDARVVRFQDTSR